MFFFFEIGYNLNFFELVYLDLKKLLLNWVKYKKVIKRREGIF